MEPEPAFIMGMIFGALVLWFILSLVRSRRERKADGRARTALPAAGDSRRLREIEELHERLAVLERIATDPAERTSGEIERLR